MNWNKFQTLNSKFQRNKRKYSSCFLKKKEYDFKNISLKLQIIMYEYYFYFSIKDKAIKFKV